jgi:isochorismate synthase
VAKTLIAGLEPFERELFGGIVGWCDAEGNGEWVVTIRCARIHENRVRLFAGAGIVPRLPRRSGAKPASSCPPC